MGNCTITLDTKAFESEVSARAQQRGQRVIRGIITASGTYATNGDACDLRPYFPKSQSNSEVAYRVYVFLSNTGNRLGVYDHTYMKLKVYTALNTEASGGTDQSVNGIFGFIAIGE